MRRALTLARRGSGAVAPNPMVGCVIARDGRVIGEGWHRRFGGPHAEVYALRQAGARARGATAYVTLEPCCDHAGKKTPPCAPALAAAGVREVVAAARDANPAVSGRGLKILRAAGVKTKVGTLAREAEALNRDFLARMRRKRPYVILKTALSLDGRAAARGGRSRWVTSADARRLAHRLRARADAVLVGVGTVIADDPALTAHGAGRDPLRVVLDTRLRTPRRARLLHDGGKTIVFTTRPGRLSGAETVRVPAKRGRVSLPAALTALAARGVGSLLVEGGPTVHASFLESGLVDEAQIFLAPKLLSGSDDPNAAPRLARPKLRRVGGDFLISGIVSRR